MKEVSIATSVGELGGILYGQADKPVVLALHGWLDNAASFNTLAPMLENHAVLALDLPGHGCSAWLGAGADYSVWAYVRPIIEAVNTYPLLKERPFHLLGHSLGTGVAMLLACTMPDKVRSYIALDSLGPITTQASLAAAQLKQSLQAKAKESSTYSDIEQAVAVRMRGNSAIPEAGLKQIVERNLKQQQAGWQWCTDPRLRLPSAVRFTEEQLHSILQSLNMPVLAIRAEQGIAPDVLFKQRLVHITKGSFASVAGGHHFHIEMASAIEIAQHITSFIGHD